MDPMIGTITIFAGNFAPRGWAFCDGALLQITNHPALFSILGTRFGGDGLETFALPDMRGRVAAHFGGAHALGTAVGTETVTLTVEEMPRHGHDMVFAQNAGSGAEVVPAGMGAAAMLTKAGAAGGGGAHPNMQPTLYLAFIIATDGVFPSRP